MIALRLTVVLVLIFCSAKALPVARDWSVYDKEHGQYSMAALSAETTILRYRTYRFTLEISHTTKYTDQEIIALFTTAGTDATKIAELETEFTKRGTSMLQQTQSIMDMCIEFTALTGTINDDISSNAYGLIAMDKTLLKNEYDDFGANYDLYMENAFLSATIAKMKVLNTIGAQTGDEITQILTLVDETEALLLSHRKMCDDQKLLIDTAYTVGDAALAQLVLTLPAPAN